MERYRIAQNAKLDLMKWDLEETSEFEGGKEKAKERLRELNLELESLQEILYAEHKHRVLVILQAMDTGGKDGVIRKVFVGVNPQGVKVANFKVPTPIELDHDYLWRVHLQTPGKGEIVIFNRSHYEDVLVVRVHEIVPKEVWKKRFTHINEFERMLAEEGTSILKFFLHIDRAEQKRRLQSRLDDASKHWKFNVGDLKERNLWGQYMKAYGEGISRTSTPWAPWYVVPANRKWYRDIVVATVLVKALKDLKMSYPEPAGLDETVVIED